MRQLPKKIMVQEASTRIERIPAKYRTETETIETSPATTKWVKRKADRNCLSADPNDCLVWCLVEVPAQYRTVTKQIRSGYDAGYVDNGDDCTKVVEVPARYETRTYRKLVSPATTTVEEIPAKYETRTFRKLVSPATTTVDIESDQIEAQYTTVSKQVLVKKGGFTEWREVVCSANVTTAMVTKVQKALLDMGYDIGPAGIDNVMGADTKAALTKFQKDKGLPVGQLDLETLKILGVDY
jgi:hypothetical protein